MITGEIKNKVDSIWTSMWAGGVTNPLLVIEQLTYLIFIKSLDTKELQNETMEMLSKTPMPKIFPSSEMGQSMRWSKFKNRDSREMYDIVRERVFPAIKGMRDGRLPDFDSEGNIIEIVTSGNQNDSPFSVYMKDAVFAIPTPAVLQTVVTGLDKLLTKDVKDLDMQGDLYEYMLGKLSISGQNGQFRTPKHIRDMMVELVAPTPEDSICDPACGTAGFLISAAEYIRRNHSGEMTSAQWDYYDSKLFTGFDTDMTMLRISAMNLMLHSIGHPDVRYNDSVSRDYSDSERYTVCLANPPFKGTVNEENINERLASVVNTKKTELLFLALFLRIMKMGGRCACIVPDGVLFGSSKAHKSIRKELVEHNKLVAVISMPSGVFKPYAGVSTAILVFIKTNSGGTDNVWFYNMESDGFSLDDKRTPLENSDISDIVARFKDLESEKSRSKTEKSFMVTKEEIVNNDYDLSINKYREVIHEQEQYRPTTEILEDMIRLNDQLAVELRKLREMLE